MAKIKEDMSVYAIIGNGDIFFCRKRGQRVHEAVCLFSAKNHLNSCGKKCPVLNTKYEKKVLRNMLKLTKLKGE